MGIEQGRAQRWHDTDHGSRRTRPLRSNRFRTAAPDRGRPPVSVCWCCCERCDPIGNPDRSNPFWSRARAEQDHSAAGLPS